MYVIAEAKYLVSVFEKKGYGGHMYWEILCIACMTLYEIKQL